LQHTTDGGMAVLVSFLRPALKSKRLTLIQGADGRTRAVCSPVRWTSQAGVQTGWISSARALITSATTNTGMVLLVSSFHTALHSKPLTSM
jgi:hypothetical protein